MAEQYSSAGEETGKVLAVSTLVAGAAAGVGVLLRGRSSASKEQTLLARQVEQRRAELSDLNSALDSRRKELSDLLSTAGKQGRKALKDANVPAMELSEVDWSAFSRRARKGLERARAEAVKHAPSDLNGRRDALRKSGGEAAKATRSFGERAAEQISRRATELLESAESELGPRAKSFGERASGVASTTASSSRDTADALRHKVDDVKPQLEDLATKAGDAVRHGIEEAGPRLDHLSERARKVAANAPDKFTTEFQRAEEALGAIASNVQDRTSDVAHVVEEKSKAGAKAVKQGGKEGTSALFWMGAAASVTYFVILSDEQREKVRHIVGRVINEAREIYADIQGEDGKF
jgi:uncharacterized coiled-coil DUF342 family protein